MKGENIKTELSLANIAFSDLKISLPIRSYNYLVDRLMESNQYYPLLLNDELVAFALIYGKNDTYLYDGTKIHCLINHNLNIDGRKNINDNSISNKNLYTSIITKPINDNPKKITYTTSTQRSRKSAYLSVPRIGQGNYENICWAASSASIINYFRGTSYSATSIASAYYGSNFNNKLDISYIHSLLSSYAIYNYNYISYMPSYQTIYSNISSGYPVYGSFTTGAKTHANVIYGIDISLMDPYGSGTYFSAYYTYSPNDNPVLSYVYTNASVNLTLWFVRASVRYT